MQTEGQIPSRNTLLRDPDMLMTNIPFLNHKNLPCFACSLDKRPLTKNGYKDATTDYNEFVKRGNLKESDSFLYGVPTGELTGFDVLDIDLQGIEWKNKQKDIHTTRTHQTRSSGYHLLFQHHNGLRNSTSKLAEGVDVRADGGYIIWWPSHTFEVKNHDTIEPWPNWLLDLLTKSNRAVSAKRMVTPDITVDRTLWFSFRKCMELLAPDDNDNEIVNEIYMQLLAEGRSGVTMPGDIYTVSRFSKESKYAIQAATNTIFRIEGSVVGTRNNTLNAESYALGRIMARGWTPVGNLIRALWRGAVRCGLVNDDGVFQTVNTIVSGLLAGIENPYPDLGEKKE